MKRYSTMLVCPLLIAILLATAVSARAGDAKLAPDIQTGQLTHDGMERAYLLYVPEGAPRPMPLVMVLHGGGGRVEMMRQTGFEPLAAKGGFAVVYPKGFGGWADGRNTAFIRGRVNDADDSGFLRALLEKVVADGVADPNKLFVTGASNGGMMTMRMVCEHADVLAGAASVIGLMPQDLAPSCEPVRPVPLLIILGTHDTLVPFRGGAVGRGGSEDRGVVLSTGQTMDFWRQAFACAEGAVMQALPDIDPEDGMDSVQSDWSGCAEGVPLKMIAIKGGGHRWPGTRLERPGRRGALTGLATQDFSGTEVILDFFGLHTLRP